MKIQLLSTLLLTVIITACTRTTPEAATLEISVAEVTKTSKTQVETLDQALPMQIQVQGNGQTIVFQLNDSAASKSLYSQLPMKIQVEDYSTNEKIFYLSDQLEIGDTPLTKGGEAGQLAYFSPWGNVVMYYGAFGPYSGLYDLGTAISGGEWIEELSGEILVEAMETQD